MKTDDQQVLRAIIVDDEGLARKGLAMRLQEFNNVELVEEACNADEALNLITIHEPVSYTHLTLPTIYSV